MSLQIFRYQVEVSVRRRVVRRNRMRAIPRAWLDRSEARTLAMAAYAVVVALAIGASL